MNKIKYKWTNNDKAAVSYKEKYLSKVNRKEKYLPKTNIIKHEYFVGNEEKNTKLYCNIGSTVAEI